MGASARCLMKTLEQLRKAGDFKALPCGRAKAGGWRMLGLFTVFLTAVDLLAETLVPAGSVWRYRDDGSDQGTAWLAPAFDDAGWRSGRAQLGYGDGDEATVISYGTNSNNKFVTTYFRHSFTVPDPTRYTDYTISLLRDDGAGVYLNGREVFRSNLPSGAVHYRTFASSNVGGAAESSFYLTTVAASNLVAGINVLAVEVHQGSTNSSDLSFDLELVGNKVPIPISNNLPSDGALGVSTAPTLQVLIPDTRGESLAVTFYGRPAGPPPGPDFTLVALPDTQCYVASRNGGRPETFTAQADWIVTNKTARNIVFVTQLGDCSENGDNGGNNAQWLHATNALYRLENPATTLAEHGIPYGVAVGNHDQSPNGDADGATRFYNEYFGASHFTGRPYYGGHWGTNNDNHFELFSASGLDFIALHLEYDATPDTNVLNWANSLLQTNRDRRAIVISHYLIDAGNPASFSAQGRATYDALKANPNLFLMLCGHVIPEEGQRQDTLNGHTVHTLMSDYQSRTNGGSGWLRLLEFSPSNNVIRVKTYSPTFDQFETDANSQFTLSYDMRGGGSFSPLASFPDISAATNLSVVWDGLANATAYDWYITVSDGTDTTTSPMWRFTTISNAPPTVVVTRVSDAQVSGFVPSVTLAIEAAATDPDGVIRQVEFYQGDTMLAEDTDSPFSCTWNNVPIGLYAITAVAEDNGGLRATSAPVTIAVELPDNPVGKDVAAPDHLTATVVSSNQVLLEWTDLADNELGFVVERSADGTHFSRVAVLEADAQSCLDTGLEAATRYTYRICAFNANSLSDFSNLAEAMTPAGSAGQQFTVHLHFDRANNLMVLSWPSTPGTVYRVVARNHITDPGWTDLSDEIAASASTTMWSEPVAGMVPQRFYGVRVVR